MLFLAGWLPTVHTGSLKVSKQGAQRNPENIHTEAGTRQTGAHTEQWLYLPVNQSNISWQKRQSSLLIHFSTLHNNLFNLRWNVLTWLLWYQVVHPATESRVSSCVHPVLPRDFKLYILHGIWEEAKKCCPLTPEPWDLRLYTTRAEVKQTGLSVLHSILCKYHLN